MGKIGRVMIPPPNILGHCERHFTTTGAEIYGGGVPLNGMDAW